MKNITITVEEEVARWAKIYAAKHDTSVSRMLGQALKGEMEKEQSYEKAKGRFLERRPSALKPSKGKYPSRGELYER